MSHGKEKSCKKTGQEKGRREEKETLVSKLLRQCCESFRST
jgi:hypothetical protein